MIPGLSFYIRQLILIKLTKCIKHLKTEIMESNLYAELIPFLLALIVFLILFLILRSINLWYFRINTIVTNQERNNQLLSELINLHTKKYTEVGKIENQDSYNEKGEVVLGNKKVEILDGKKVAITGHFPIDYRMMEIQLSTGGAIFQKSIDVDSDYLITGNNPVHGDIQAARANNIEIFSFRDYIELTNAEK